MIKGSVFFDVTVYVEAKDEQAFDDKVDTITKSLRRACPDIDIVEENDRDVEEIDDDDDDAN